MTNSESNAMNEEKQQPQPDPVETSKPWPPPGYEGVLIHEGNVPDLTATTAPVVSPELPAMPPRPVELEGPSALSLSIRNQAFELASRDLQETLRPVIAVVEDNAKAIGELSVVSKEAAETVASVVEELSKVPEGMVRIDGKLYPKWKCGYYLRESKDFPGFFIDANDRVYEKLPNGAMVRRTYKKNERRAK